MPLHHLTSLHLSFLTPAYLCDSTSSSRIPSAASLDPALNAPRMAFRSRYSRHVRRDRLSVNVIPEQSRDIEPQTPYLHWLFGESSEEDVCSRLIDNDADAHNGTGYNIAEAMIIKEVAAWLDLCERDDFWATKDKHARKVCRGLNACRTVTDEVRLFSLQPAKCLRE